MKVLQERIAMYRAILSIISTLAFLTFFPMTTKGQTRTVDVRGKAIERNAHTGAIFQMHEMSYLNITALGVDYVHSSMDCGLACINMPSCFSFNLAAIINMNRKILCELLPSDIFNNSDKLVADHLFHHFSIWLPCLNKPCQNKGTCRSNYAKNSYVCVCAEGYTGNNCETDIDDCANFPCLNNGTCSDHVGGFRCTCSKGFGGLLCEIVPKVEVSRSCDKSPFWQLPDGDVVIEANQIGTEYDNSTDCHWNISSNARIEISFLVFEMENGPDAVQVYDGESSSAPLIGRFTGKSLPSPVTSSSSKLFLQFATDASARFFGFRARVRALADGALRIAGTGNNSFTGRMEVFFNNKWGTICDNGWNIHAGLVACKQLGFDNVSQVFSGASHGQGIGPIWINDLSCFGNEPSISSCGHSGLGNKENCSHSQDASVTCSYDSLPIRLVNGGARYGRVEVFDGGVWGTICDDTWDMNDAHVTCRELGFTGASSISVSAADGQGSGLIWRDHINCVGSESSLLQCPFTQEGFNHCNHGEDSGVRCF